MERERWLKVKKILDSVLDLPKADQAAYLDEACGDDTALRRDVETYLGTDEGEADFIDNPVGEFKKPPCAKDMIGQRLGPYHIDKILGEGGMGVVYLATRSDEEFERRVAIKILKRGLDTELVVARFRKERQILANLNHPNIAKLYEGGTTKTGLPYFVMEYVEGEPLDQYCDEHKLDVAARMRLMIQVCQAVQYAHRGLIVHRDLKPANVLVTGQGVPKLLDFGIAKLLIDRAEEVTMTVTGVRPMTPEYASPEQVMGEPITTATDVYALGVMAYELLTGTRPYYLKRRQADEIHRVVCQQQPPKPSEVVLQDVKIPKPNGNHHAIITPERMSRDRGGNPRKLANQLRGDVDTILLTALRKEPDRRYATAQQLAEDMERHLTGFPVKARKDTFAYRTGKFIRRHPIGFWSGVAVTLLLLIFTALLMVEQERTRQALKRADTEQKTASEVIKFLSAMFKSPNPSRARGRTIKAISVLEEGTHSINQKLKEQPIIQARLLQTMGRVYTNMGIYHKAEPLLKRALAIQVDNLEADHTDLLVTRRNLTDLYIRRGSPDLAETILAETRPYIEKGSIHDAYYRLSLGRIHNTRQEWAKAETHLLAALTLLVDHRTENHELTKYRQDLAANYQHQQRFEDAEVLRKKIFDYYNLHRKDQLAEAVTQLIDLYTAWDRPEQLHYYQEFLENMPKVETP